MNPSYQPKGSMCAVCEHKHRDCSHLPFETMPMIIDFNEGIVVRCIEFKKEVKK